MRAWWFVGVGKRRFSDQSEPFMIIRLPLGCGESSHSNLVGLLPD